jgi:ATP-dependent Lon protease
MLRHLPLFPLRLVAFPQEKLNLHIFEPRYRQLIGECERTGMTFGIPAFIDDTLVEIGTEMRLVSIEKRHPAGELDIRTEGVGIFRLDEFYSEGRGRMYPSADVEPLKVDREGDFLKNEKILSTVMELFETLRIQKKVPANDAQFLTFDVAHHVGFTLEQEYAFLCIPTEAERQDYMLEHLAKTLPVVREIEHLRQRALMNGHFKHIIPPHF